MPTHLVARDRSYTKLNIVKLQQRQFATTAYTCRRKVADESLKMRVYIAT